MGLFSNTARSFKKSKELRRLQLIISPPNQSARDVATDFTRMLREKSNEREQALQDFLDLCESDDGVAQVMAMEGVTRSDLEDLYHLLTLNGLGQWVKGHFAALSTIAYAEPLLYAVRAQAQVVGPRDIAYTLLEYWEGRIRQGSLLQR
jgi:hypothetical protein